MRGAQFRTSETVDFLVVGSGAAGGVMAKELAVGGFSVVVLEQGPYLTEQDFGHDEIKYAVQNALTNNTKLQPITYRRHEDEAAKPLKAIEYGRQVGGGTVHFTANYWRLHESDFHERSLYGEIPGTSFADWPIRYSDLEPYYTKAEEELGISGLGGANPFEAPRSKPYPLPPMPVKSSGVLFERGAKKLGLASLSSASCDSFAALSGPRSVRTLRHVRAVWLRDESQIEHAGKCDSGRGKDGPLRDPRRTPTCARSRPTRVGA